MRICRCAWLVVLALSTAACVADQALDVSLDASAAPVLGVAAGADSAPQLMGPERAAIDAAPIPPINSTVVPPSTSDWPQKGFTAGNAGATAAVIPDSPVVEWQATLPGDSAYTGAVVGNGRIYFLLYGAGVAALDLATGNLLWRNQQVWGSKLRTPAYAQERLYVPTESYSSSGSKDPTAGTVVALDARTGELLWRGSEAATTIRELGGDVFLAGMGGPVHCLDGATGIERWGEYLNCDTRLALEGEAGFCLSSSLIAFDRRTGQQLYAVPRGSGFNFSDLAVADGRIYYQSDEMLYARSASDGSVLWSVPVGFSPVGNGIIDTTPAVLGDRVFVATQSNVMAFSTDGRRLWSVPAPEERNPGTLSVAGNRLLLGGSAMHDADTGRALWTAPAGMPVLTMPPIVDGHFYTYEGSSVYAWGEAL